MTHHPFHDTRAARQHALFSPLLAIAVTARADTADENSQPFAPGGDGSNGAGAVE